MQQIKILVVDDEPINLDIIAECLGDQGYQLEMAADGIEAWEALSRDPDGFSMILLDRMMPRMNGLELLRKIRADSRFQRMPVIMQTAAGSPEQVREGLSAGAFYYLVKPYDPETMIAIVASAVEKIEAGRLHDENIKMLVQAIGLLQQGEYRFSNLKDARTLAKLFASLCPMPDIVAMGFTEILVNAVEHGNLGISYQEKKQLRQSDNWETEVERRLSLPEYLDRRVEVQVRNHPSFWTFKIKDEGAGFDWKKYYDFDPERAFDPNGRGIAMSRQLSFSRLEYLGCGNEVLIEVGKAEND
jgi:CheY-like chemotaxis protein